MKRIATLAVAAGIVLAGCSTNEGKPASEPEEKPSATEKVKETAKGSSANAASSAAPTKRSLPPNVRTSRDGARGSADGAEGANPKPSSPKCGSDSATAAVQNNIALVKPSTWDWDASSADIDGYDPCATLSWITVTIHGATSSSPFQIMLFKNGEYLGTTTSEAYGFMPTVTRAGDDAINVVYHYPLPGESNANRSGEAHASFRWSESAERIIMTGDVPPQ